MVKYTLALPDIIKYFYVSTGKFWKTIAGKNVFLHTVVQCLISIFIFKDIIL